MRQHFVCFSGRNGVCICLRHVKMQPQVIHRTALIVSSSPMQISSPLVLNRSEIDHFSRSRGSSLTRRFVYFSGRNGVLYMFAHVAMWDQVYHRTNQWCPCLQNRFHLNSCSKGSILAFCRGLADRHLRGVLSIPEDETAFYIRLRIATTRPQVYHRTTLTCFLSPIYISSQLVLKRFNIDHFLRSRIVLYAEFFYFSGQNGASNMFAQHHDVLSRISKISTNHFFQLQYKLLCLLAQKGQLCNIFRGCIDHLFCVFLTITQD